MRYVSTRGQAPALGFEDAVLAGLARDGGLYVPENWPLLGGDEREAIAALPYAEAAARVMHPFTGEALSLDELNALTAKAYRGFAHPATAPLVQTGPSHWIIELFHGPTLAFKDLAMQVIGHLFDQILERKGETVTIVGATSGDTGSAAIEAFRGRERARVFILYPDGRVSDVQRRQMTTPVEDNVQALAIKGDFDACQALVKGMFNDHAFRDRMALGAVNSINWARVLAQVVYYATSSMRLAGARSGTQEPSRVNYSVPTGNFGDIFAGLVAKRMGFPVGRLLIATNENDILHRTLQSGRYETRPTERTLTPSMDIQVSSNFERLLFEVMDRDGAAVAALMDELKATGAFALSQGQVERLREDFDSASIDREGTVAEIRRTRDETGMVLDPHTAVGHAAAREWDVEGPVVTLATAHPAKFAEAVVAATGAPAPLPPHLADLMEREERMTRLPDDLAAVEAHIEGAARRAAA